MRGRRWPRSTRTLHTTSSHTAGSSRREHRPSWLLAWLQVAVPGAMSSGFLVETTPDRRALAIWSVPSRRASRSTQLRVLPRLLPRVWPRLRDRTGPARAAPSRHRRGVHLPGDQLATNRAVLRHVGLRGDRARRRGLPADENPRVAHDAPTTPHSTWLSTQSACTRQAVPRREAATSQVCPVRLVS